MPMKNETMPNPTINGFYFLSIPDVKFKIEIFYPKANGIGYVSCAIADFEPDIPAFTLNNCPMDSIHELYGVFIHFYKIFRGIDSPPMFRQTLPDLDGTFVFRLNPWKQRNVINGHLAEDGVKHHEVEISFKHRSPNAYQRSVRKIAYVLGSNSEAPLIHIGSPGLPARTIKQLVEAVKENVISG